MYKRIPQIMSYVVVIVMSCLPVWAYAEEQLVEQMTAEEFSAAGLHKLTAEELAYLARWLDGRAPVAAPAAPAPAKPSAPVTTASPEERFGQEQVEREPEPDVPDQIAARLKGEFRGWDGNTIFRLDNGQVWQQRVGGKYRSKKHVDPEVIVEKGRFGYYLRLADGGRSVGVRRLK